MIYRSLIRRIQKKCELSWKRLKKLSTLMVLCSNRMR